MPQGEQAHPSLSQLSELALSVNEGMPETYLLSTVGLLVPTKLIIRGEITMDTFTVTTFINRPLQEVFDFITNPANSAQWQSGTESAKWASEGPVGVGSIVTV